AWTEMCAGPLDKIYSLSNGALDMMLRHAGEVEDAARWRFGLIAVALAIAVAFCFGGLMLVRRRVAAPVAELTRTIERLAQRQYDTPVARSACHDEFGTKIGRAHV